MPSFDRERIDTALLIGAFVLGIGSSLVLKANEYSVWLPAFTSGCIIVAYAAIAYNSGRARLEPDQIGDNAYYLGFVLTLTSLAYTLYKIEPQAPDSELFGDVISGFGIALSSTIVGVIVRVILLQYRVDLVAREKEVRLELNDAMRRFHVQIEDAVRGTKYLCVEIRQSLSEYHQQMATNDKQRTQKLAEEISTGFQQVLENILEQSREANAGLGESMHNTISNAEQAVQEMVNTVSGLLSETNAAINESTRTTTEALKRNLQETGEATSEVMRELRINIGRSVEEMSSAHTESVKRGGTLTEEAAVSFKRSLKEADDVTSEVMDELRTNVRRSIEEMSSIHTESIKRGDVHMEEALTSMQQAIDTFKKGFDENLDEVQTTMAKFSTVIGKTHTGIDNLAENLERLNQKILKKVDDSPSKGRFKIFGRTPRNR